MRDVPGPSITPISHEIFNKFHSSHESSGNDDKMKCHFSRVLLSLIFPPQQKNFRWSSVFTAWYSDVVEHHRIRLRTYFRWPGWCRPKMKPLTLIHDYSGDDRCFLQIIREPRIVEKNESFVSCWKLNGEYFWSWLILP